MKHIKKTAGDKFGLSVAGYPEGHPNVIKEVLCVHVVHLCLDTHLTACCYY